MKPVDGTTVVTTPTASFWFDDDGIARHSLRSGVHLALDDAKVNFDALVSMTGGKRVPMIVDFSLGSATQAVRRYYASDEAAGAVSAVALIISSPVGRVIGNFFVGLNRPPYPVCMVASEREALAWLGKQA